MNEGDTHQDMDSDIRQHNLPAESEKGGDADSGNSEKEEEGEVDDSHTDDGERSQDVDCGVTSSEINQRVKSSQKKHVQSGVSAQSNAEGGDFDTSDGKCIKGKNENNEVPETGDGPRSWTASEIQKKVPDTEQPEDTDTRVHNQQKETGVSAQSNAEGGDFDTSDGKCIKGKNENNEVPEAGDGPRLRTANKIQKKVLDTEQPEDTDTRVHNQQKKTGVSAQSNAEGGDFDTSDGKCIKGKNENNEVPEAGDGPRLRTANKIQKKAHLAKGDVLDHVETKGGPVAADTSRWYILPAALFSLLVVVILLLLRNSSPPLQEEFNLLKVFCQEMDKVQASFPSQHRELWRRSRIHLQKHLNLTNPTEPVSLILTSGRGAEKTLSCLAQQLARAFSNALNSSVVGIDGTSKSAQDSDQVKLDIDKALKEAFDSGTQAAVIHRFEELPPGSTLIFYRYCDHENAVFKKVFLAFTVMLQEEMDFPPNVHLGTVEEVVQEYLKEKFVSSDRTAKFNQMDLDKLSGLWSRISHLILPVAAEQKIEQYGCQT